MTLEFALQSLNDFWVGHNTCTGSLHIASIVMGHIAGTTIVHVECDAVRQNGNVVRSYLTIGHNTSILLNHYLYLIHQMFRLRHIPRLFGAIVIYLDSKLIAVTVTGNMQPILIHAIISVFLRGDLNSLGTITILEVKIVLVNANCWIIRTNLDLILLAREQGHTQCQYGCLHKEALQNVRFHKRNFLLLMLLFVLPIQLGCFACLCTSNGISNQNLKLFRPVRLK